MADVDRGILCEPLSACPWEGPMVVTLFRGRAARRGGVALPGSSRSGGAGSARQHGAREPTVCDFSLPDCGLAAEMRERYLRVQPCGVWV